jgi:hypothetical protein
MITVEEIRVADECWIALALLHQAHPERQSFSAREILDRLKLEKAHPEVRAGVSAHIYQHNVANVEPSSARYRMFRKLEDGAYRLFRPGDDFHPARKGKTAPERSELPARYHHLLDWYEREYCSPPTRSDEERDPILQMRGVGKDVWAALGGGDAFVARERAGWDAGKPATARVGELAARTWKRAVAHQGEVFHTITRKSFTYAIEGESGIWFYRNSRRIPKKLRRGDLEKAVRRCPLRRTADIKDCFDPSYLYALLMDRRIRGNDW